MRRLLAGIAVTAGLVSVDATRGQDKERKPRTDRVIVLIDAKTEGVAKGAKIEQIEAPKGSAGKRGVKDAKADGKDRPRLNGTWVVKECAITLADGKVLQKRKVLVATEVGKQTLKGLKYVETCEAQGDRGAGKWHAYTAEYEVRE